MELRILIFKDHDQWVAQCLDYNVAAQAKDLTELQYQMERVLAGHFLVSLERGETPFEALPPAPKWYWDRFREAAPLEMEQWTPRFAMAMPLPPDYPRITSRHFALAPA